MKLEAALLPQGVAGSKSFGAAPCLSGIFFNGVPTYQACLLSVKANFSVFILAPLMVCVEVKNHLDAWDIVAQSSIINCSLSLKSR